MLIERYNDLFHFAEQQVKLGVNVEDVRVVPASACRHPLLPVALVQSHLPRVFVVETKSEKILDKKKIFSYIIRNVFLYLVTLARLD